MLGNLYVIGPVTGKPNDNRPAFAAARCNLRQAGYWARIPHDCIAPGTPWGEAMRTSIHQLTLGVFDGVATLPGWEDSPGARLEAQVAEAIGLPVKTAAEWVEVAL